MIKYSNLPRKIKKGLKRAAKRQMSSWKWKQIHIQYVVKCSRSIGCNEPKKVIIDGKPKIQIGTYREGNAKLIAAAPEMCRDLNSLILSITSHPDYIEGHEDDEWHTLVSLAQSTLEKAN